eukprot:evm.model.scf_368.8 EVM.evm.TU.scf_368.8   scf_368:75707-77381(-)
MDGSPDFNALQYLVSPQKQDAFIAADWEAGPKLFKGDDERRQAFAGLFNRRSLTEAMRARDAAKGGGAFRLGADVIAARYLSGERETVGGDVSGCDAIWSLFEDGCTLQVIQPQRYTPALRALCARLESQLGCLVGCNAYVTPGGTQGLAPHHDDVELFVCQTEGCKAWRLYGPIGGHGLPSLPSKDLAQEELGPPILEVTLHVGDVLYVPRGIVHQAVAQDGASVHLTISTYQRWTWGDLAATVVQGAVMAQKGPDCAPHCLRQGLPHGFVYGVGTHPLEAPDASRDAAKELAARLRALADVLEKHDGLVRSAADAMAEDFVGGRMPPPEGGLRPRGPAPGPGDRVRRRGDGLMRLARVEAGEEPVGVDHAVQLLTCMKNSVHGHMMAGGEESEEEEEERSEESQSDGDDDIEGMDGDGEEGSEEDEDGQCVLVLRAALAEPLAQIVGSGDEGVAVAELKGVEGEAERIGFVTELWREGLIETRGAGAEGGRQKRAKR